MIKFIPFMMVVALSLPSLVKAQAPGDVAVALDSDEAKLALAQCLVSESGWGRITEYSAISHLLARRWKRLHHSQPVLTFEAFTRQYCAVHRVAHPTPRQQWVRRLPWGDLEQNPGFPAAVAWQNYVRPWRTVLEFVEGFRNGEYRDPTPTADHWGGSMDGVPIGGRLLPAVVPSVDPTTVGRMVTLGNRFYDIDMGVRRRFLLSRRQYEQDRAAGVTSISVRRMMQGR